MAKPFKVLSVQQIAVGGGDKNRLRFLWEELLGATFSHTFRSEVENVDEDVLGLGHGPFQIEIDVMQPIDPDKSPKVHEPALNHLGLWVDDLHSAVAWLGEKGVRFAGGIRKGAAGHDIAFIHPKASPEKPQSGEGVLIELVQAPESVIRAYELLSREFRSIPPEAP